MHQSGKTEGKKVFPVLIKIIKDPMMVLPLSLYYEGLIKIVYIFSQTQLSLDHAHTDPGEEDWRTRGKQAH